MPEHPEGTLARWIDDVDDGRPRLTDEVRELRDELDEVAHEASTGVPADQLPLRLPKRRIEALLTCPRRALAEVRAPHRAASAAMSIGVLTERACRLHLWDRYPYERPGELAAVMAEVAAAHGEEVPGPADPQWDEVGRRADRFVRSLPHPPTDLHAAERIVVPLAAGADGRPAVVLQGHTDLSLGVPGGDGPTGRRAVVELKAGRVPPDALNELAWYQLLVALRERAAPHGVALWAAEPDDGTAVAGRVVDSPVSIGSLRSAVQRLCHALDELGAIARGEQPAERPSPLGCAGCPERDVCPSAIHGEADDWLAELGFGADEDGW